MNHIVPAIGLLMLAVSGCGQPSSPSAPKSVAPKTESPPAAASKSDRKKVPPAKPPLDQRRYGGLTHFEWATRIRNLDPKGSEAAAGVDGMVALLRDHDVPNATRTQAAIVLGRMGKTAAPAVPILSELLRKNGRSNHPHDLGVAHWTLRALAMLGPVAKSATPELTRLLEDSGRPIAIRGPCLEALARIGDSDPRAVHALMKMLSYRFNSRMPYSDKIILRGAAINGIALVGPSASAAIPSLILLSRNASDTIRRKSAVALGTMGRQGSDGVVPLFDLLTQDDSPAVRDAAADALAKTGDLGVRLLKKLLEHDDVEVQRRAARSLGKAGASAKTAIDELDFALDDPDGWVRIYAAESLWAIEQKTDRVVPAYVEELKNPDRQIRIKAYRLLRQLGPKAKSGTIALNKLLSDERGYVRSVAARALRDLEAAR